MSHALTRLLNVNQAGFHRGIFLNSVLTIRIILLKRSACMKTIDSMQRSRHRKVMTYMDNLLDGLRGVTHDLDPSLKDPLF